jgi:type I restriction enzyme, S subunit
MVTTAQDTKLKPGYKQTEVGVIPEDWKVTKLREVADVKTGPFGSALHEKDYVDDGTPIITVEHLGEQGVVYVNLPMVSDLDRKRLKAYSLLKGDIVFSRVGSVDRNSLIKEEENDWLFSGRLLRIRVKTSDIYSSFLSYYFNQEHTKQRIRAVAVGQTMASLNTQILRNIDIAFPPTKSEQKAIAAALSDVDALITSLDRLIAKKRDIKQATMQQLLTGKTRLPGFSGKWEVKKLGEVGKPFGGLSGKSKENFVDGQYPYIPFLNIMNNPVININYFDYVNIDPGESQNKAIKGDLFFNGSSETPEEVGMCSMLNEDIPNLYLNSFCFGFRLNRELKTNGLYLSYYFRSSIGRQLFYSLAQGATRYNLSKSNFLKMEIPYPGPEEQTAIAAILSNMDAEIAALEQQRDKTRDLKQGMMQELLTGKTRLV